MPIIEIYVTLLLVNSLSREDFLSRLAGLLRTVAEWGMKSLLGSGALIKNAIGTAELIFLILLCLVPVLKLGIISFLYQGAAVVQPAADKRIVACISAVGNGTRLVLYTVILFLVTVALVCAASNANYYAG